MINEDAPDGDACVESCPNKVITAGEPLSSIRRCATECVGAHDEPQCMLVCRLDWIVDHPEHRESKDELAAKYIACTASVRLRD